MHSWNDSWPYWDDLYTAERYIGDYVYKWSRCRLQSKEKWGILRYEHVWPPSKGCGLVIKAPWTKKYSWSDEPIHPILFMWSNSWLYYKWRGFGTRCLIKAVRNACKMWPQCEKEIKGDLEFLLDRKI
jgi:hypothetical protein